MTQSDLNAALAEWRAALARRLDFPETHFQFAGIALTMRNMAAAERAFAEVVALDPQRQEAWVMRVRIAAAVEGPARALAITEEALAALPDDPTLLGFRAELADPVVPPDPLPPRRAK